MNGNSRPDVPNTPPSQPRLVQLAPPQVKPLVTYAIMGATLFVYLLQLAGQYLLQVDIAANLGARVNELIRAGQLWRLITPVFLHVSVLPYGLLHIGFNMYALYLFGRGLEARFGHTRFALLYFLSAFAGNVLSFLMTAMPSLGSTNAVFGLLGAEGMFIVQNRQLLAGRAGRALFNLLLIIGINFLIGFSLKGVDNFGNLGGILGGVIFTWFGGPRFKIEGFASALKLVDERQGHGALSGTVAVLLFFIPLTVLGWIWIVQ